jgi:hypothetical protein
MEIFLTVIRHWVDHRRTEVIPKRIEKSHFSLLCDRLWLRSSPSRRVVDESLIPAGVFVGVFVERQVDPIPKLTGAADAVSSFELLNERPIRERIKRVIRNKIIDGEEAIHETSVQNPTILYVA